MGRFGVPGGGLYQLCNPVLRLQSSRALVTMKLENQ
jgi:hypothetical protein